MFARRVLRYLRCEHYGHDFIPWWRKQGGIIQRARIIDIIARKDGQDYRIEGDFLRDVARLLDGKEPVGARHNKIVDGLREAIAFAPFAIYAIGFVAALGVTLAAEQANRSLRIRNAELLSRGLHAVTERELPSGAGATVVVDRIGREHVIHWWLAER